MANEDGGIQGVSFCRNQTVHDGSSCSLTSSGSLMVSSVAWRTIVQQHSDEVDKDKKTSRTETSYSDEVKGKIIYLQKQQLRRWLPPFLCSRHTCPATLSVERSTEWYTKLTSEKEHTHSISKEQVIHKT